MPASCNRLRWGYHCSTQLYTKILDIQAHVPCYLKKHSVTQLFSDMFKKDAWDTLRRDIERFEVSESRLADLFNAVETRERLESRRTALDKCLMWQTTTARDERAKKLFRVLYTCPYNGQKESNYKRFLGV
ncbi:hypothetical protein BDV28DRAFT_126477 [Aspergillus coremiiformis]|uniref:Uncharacterized protein n=1 Tax=Aspergillus coremiiformis TaxID=138285 RepID=A0A5N6ZIH0_9EURO|nr:hypothetical protein BDV28DRAFT_126477 [Aspergillus coremiiformis]